MVGVAGGAVAHHFRPDPGAAGARAAELLEVLIPSFLASQVAKGKSMLAGRLGDAVASKTLEIVDDPLCPQGTGAAAFDGEGVPSRRNVLVESGALRMFLADSFWGRKLGTGSTASCRRSTNIPRCLAIKPHAETRAAWDDPSPVSVASRRSP